MQDVDFWRCSRVGIRAKRPPSLKSVTHIFYNDETWHSYTLPTEDPKIYMNEVTHPLSSTDISILSWEISNLCSIMKYRYRLHFNT